MSSRSAKSSKSSNRRKGAAIGLAVLGIAGLSLASASQLTLTSANTAIAQAGTATVVGACQTTPIAVTFDLAGATEGTLATTTSFGYPGATDRLVLSTIDAACAGKKLKVALGTTGNALVGAEFSTTTLAAGVQNLTLSGTGAAFGTLTATQISSVSQVSVTIYD